MKRSADPTLLNILVTGGCGFIGGALCRHLIATGRYRVWNVDKLTYAADLRSVASIEDDPRYRFFQIDICDGQAVLDVMRHGNIDQVVHLAAESHVDRSIASPAVFLETNVIGTFHLLDAVLIYWRELSREKRDNFRFHHVSTDEVFGNRLIEQNLFTETARYAPSSPYSASKAASDHFVRAWHATYGLPILLSNSCNTYGPFQYPDKLVPMTIINALRGVPIPVYGDGLNSRDWVFVEDHVRALELVLQEGAIGASYNVGGRTEQATMQVVQTICDLLDEELRPTRQQSRRSLIKFVQDRPGHDRRYGVDPSKIETELGWRPELSFTEGLRRTIRWYIANEQWWGPSVSKATRDHV